MKQSSFVLLAGSVALTAFAAAYSSKPPRADAVPLEQAVVPTKPTYAEHIAPLLNKHCVECHRPGEVAPFSLVGYENAKKWAAMSALVTSSRRMPPWKAADGYGDFHDVNRLTQTQVSTLKKWADSGAPRGDAKKEPKPPTFSGEWSLGKPDLILAPAKAYDVPLEGTDEYRNFVIKTDFKEPMYVTAMDVKPGNAKVVHHVIAFLDNKGKSHRLEQQNKDGRMGYATFGGVGFNPDGSFGGWAPGLRARHMPDGTAFKLEPGATVVMQVHYNTTGKPEKDQTRLGLYFSKTPPKQEIQLAWLLKWNLMIPAGAKNHKEVYTQTIPANITVYGVMPHMHLVGRSMKAWAQKPEGTTVPLIHVPDWDFNWQLNYAFKEPIKLPAGTKITVESVFDNSTDNPRNPNSPPKDVRFGERTQDEMMLLIAAFTVDGMFIRR